MPFTSPFGEIDLRNPRPEFAPVLLDADRRAGTSQAKARFIARLLPSLKDFAFLLPLLFLFGSLNGSRTMLGYGDTGWHIRTGQGTLQTRFPTRTWFSFSMPGREWFAWEWLWDVVFATLFNWGGMAPVVFVNIVLICLTSVLLFRLILKNAITVSLP